MTDVAADSLFPDLAVPVDPTAVPENLTPDRRRTLRQHRLVAAGIHPLTKGPLRAGDELCGTCIFRVAGRYPKCWWPRNPTAKNNADRRPVERLTNGPATDVRAWWPACPDWEWDRTHVPDPKE